MKSLFPQSLRPLLFLTFCCAAEAQQVRVELNGLRTQYENAVDREVAPLRDKYLAGLKALREKYTKAGDLESALLVDKQYKSESANLGAPTDKPPGDEAAMRRFMIGTVWSIMSDAGLRYQFREDGSIFDGKKIIAHYQVTGRRNLVMYWGGGIGKSPLECAISEDCTVIAELSGYRAVYIRVR